MLSTCPHEEELRAFAIGAVSAQRLEDVAEHLYGCVTCSETLEGLDAYADGFVSDLARVDVGRASVELDVPQEVLASARSATCSVGVTSSNMNLDPGRRYARKLAKGPCQLGRFCLQSELGDGSCWTR